MTMASDELYWDPFDTEIDTNPHPIWKRMRDEEPVYRNVKHDFWALSRFDDVEMAHKDPTTFSSAHGTVLELMSDERRSTGAMIFLDPPEHTQLRTLVSRAFTPRRIASQEPAIRDLCGELLDRVGQEFDFVQDFAARVPSMVISRLFGVAPEDQEPVRELIDETFYLDPEAGMVNDRSFNAQLKMYDYLRGEIADRRLHPRDDMFTDLVTAAVKEPDGSTRALTEVEATDFASLIIGAGTETVARLLGWAAVVLDQHPDQRVLLAANIGAIPNAVEELLRYEAPSPVQGRWLTKDVEVHGTVVPEGSKVLLLTGSAGRDERKYDRADAFDVRRAFDHHVSFGYGIHFCIGAALARLESRLALETFLRRHPTWIVDHDRAARLHTSTVRGWINVPISVG